MLQINVKKLADGDILELLKLAFELDSKAVKEGFSKYKVSATNLSELETLAKLHLTGGDVAGVLRDKSGKKIIFNVSQILGNVKSDFSGSINEKTLNLNWS